MAVASPEVSVVVSTHNRARRLADLLASLRAQTLPTERFEVIVVDDGSSDETPQTLSRATADNHVALRTFRRQEPGGPAVSRNQGWRAATAPLIAFIDDDCIADPAWLEQGLHIAAAHSGAVIQGRVDPISDEEDALSPFTRTLRIHSDGPYYQTCNIFYPRALLERLGGFDEFFTMPGGEDTDLAWRAISQGNATAYAPAARAYHAVNRIGLRGRLRVAAHWHESMVVYKRHPELRRAVFTKGIFWKPWHYALFRVFAAILLPKRLWFVRPYLVIPYVRSLDARCRYEKGNPAYALFFVVEDLVEMSAMVRASIRHRMLVL